MRDEQRPAPADPGFWDELRRFTPARIGLGRSGVALPTHEVLAFGLAHARARDAVHTPLDAAALEAGLRAVGFDVVQVRSAAPDRATYLRRPDLGRRLDPACGDALPPGGSDVALVVGDGLSSLAVQRHAVPVLVALRERLAGLTCSPVVVVQQARVAVGDEVGERLGARLAVVLVGERPGLSSPDSLGAYITFDPRHGRHDAQRNCVSNIRPEGLQPGAAAHRIAWLVRQALQRGLTGVGLKDESDLRPVAGLSSVAPLEGPTAMTARTPDAGTEAERIDVNDLAACESWARRLNTTHEKLRDAIGAVGDDPRKVEEHLKRLAEQQQGGRGTM